MRNSKQFEDISLNIQVPTKKFAFGRSASNPKIRVNYTLIESTHRHMYIKVFLVRIPNEAQVERWHDTLSQANTKLSPPHSFFAVFKL